MMVFRQIVIAINVLLLLVFGVDCLVIDNPRVTPGTKAKLGVLLAGLFLAYLALLLVFMVANTLLRQNALYLALSVYAIVPFAIGKLVSYRTLGFYMALQALALLLSAVTLYFA